MELAVGLVEGLERRVGGDGGAVAAVEASTTLVAALEDGLVGSDELPVGPESVDVGVVQHEKRVEGGEVGVEELVTASSVPVDGVVNLLQTHTGAASGGELVKGGGGSEGIVLFKSA